MKILMQLAIILFICLLGEVIAAVLPFPFPASVISMLLVLALLLWGPLKIYHIQKQADFLLDNMGFFFVPPAVAIIFSNSGRGRLRAPVSTKVLPLSGPSAWLFMFSTNPAAAGLMPRAVSVVCTVWPAADWK